MSDITAHTPTGAAPVQNGSLASSLAGSQACILARQQARSAFTANEEKALTALINSFPLDETTRRHITRAAVAIVEQSRALKNEQGSLDAFLAEFGLSNQEGVALMCLAEALLRVPDEETQDDLISEKILSGDWHAHKGKSDSLFVNASTWALMLTGSVIKLDKAITKSPADWLRKLIGRTGEPVIRRAVHQAMKIMGRQFVFSRNIRAAIKRQSKGDANQRTMSFDMLGEGARTMAAADRYYMLYGAAIDAVGTAESVNTQDQSTRDIHDRSSISVKLSALHPRYDELNRDKAISDIFPRLLALAEKAKSYDIQFTIDAEETDRLDLQLDLLSKLAEAPSLSDWNGLGLAVQAYQKRAPHVIDFVASLAKDTGRTIAARLVKGAYWDTEIKNSQTMGYDDYPVWTRKAATDVCYLYCAAHMLAATPHIYPQFATHNAHTIAAVWHMAQDKETGERKRFEYQRLHGMGALLYKAASQCLNGGTPIRTRTYAPVGEHEDLLPYLVRRLLENGANSSFVNRFMDLRVPAEQIAADPLESFTEGQPRRHRDIPLPAHLYGTSRLNSAGLNIFERTNQTMLIEALNTRTGKLYSASSIIDGQDCQTPENTQKIYNPADHDDLVGTAYTATQKDIEAALTSAQKGQKIWDTLGGAARADCLLKVADTLEAHRDDLIALLVREAGKTYHDCIAEIREAVDFCRYYSEQARGKFSTPTLLPGPTGEKNQLYLTGRGVFLCISPWNFPLAIFTGQIMAALAAGNSVIAKPADQTPLIAHFATHLFLKAGIPADCLHLLIGSGPSVGATLVSDTRISGVAFTGSTATAKRINLTLAERDGPIVPLIAETGGQNVMIVDSTALPEQVVDDVLLSAFGSAGQRCSALRVLYVHEAIADSLIEMLKGALKERTVGNPADITTDYGPIIDMPSLEKLRAHTDHLTQIAKFIARADATDASTRGSFLLPHIFEINSIDQIDGEKFGPILHIIRFKGDQMGKVVAEITGTGYGLTFGVHSRLEARWAALFDATKAGNTYINRNMTGAVVGVQPFGGEGLSGTGPKAGGPHYLYRFASERTLTINTAAVGGNTDLFTLSDG